MINANGETDAIESPNAVYFTRAILDLVSSSDTNHAGLFWASSACQI